MQIYVFIWLTCLQATWRSLISVRQALAYV